MSNRTDFDELARELAQRFNWSLKITYRVATELHNAFVAGQEAAELQHQEHLGGYKVGCFQCDILILKKQHSEQQDQLGYEIEELEKAVNVARTKGGQPPGSE